MKRMLLYVLSVAVIGAVVIFVLFSYEKDTRANIKFLAGYGWRVSEKETEIEEVVIPEVFDEIYEDYNRLQKEAGLNLEKYKGKKAVRYTYIVLNYPEDVGEDVRANVICVNGKPIAGDIMTVSLDGFMYSLNCLK